MNPAGLRADDFWIITTAVLCALSCALLGVPLVLRRMSLLGDAISHAMLPGIATAFLLLNSRALGPMLAGAVVVGLLTAVLTAALSRWGKVPEDAAMGVVFTSLFALGVILISMAASQVDLDPGCVLYGLIEFVPLDRTELLGIELPRATAGLMGVLAGNVLLLLLFYKELKIVCFDPYLATTMGISAAAVHYGLMATVAATSVAAFESVGAILVVAMLIAPAATAHLLTDRFSRMFLIAAGSGVLSAVAGYFLALNWNTSVAGMISVAAGVQFALAVLLAPRHGFVSRRMHQFLLALRITREDILGMLYRWKESAPSRGLGRAQVLAALGRGALPRVALETLRRARLIERRSDDTLELSPAGVAQARGLVQAHRLWESYLAKHLGLPLDHLHEPAERMEHYVGERLRGQLQSEIEQRSDPHGRDIPAD